MNTLARSVIVERSLLRVFFCTMFLAAAYLMPATSSAQQQVPITLSPLRIESDPNGVNIATGKTTLGLPALAVPGAPNLRFDRVQNFAPYATATVSGGSTDMIRVAVSVHTGAGASEAFICPDWDCTPSPAGSLFDVWIYMKGGSGEVYYFDSRMVETAGTTRTIVYYATAVHYPDGEVITYTYDKVNMGSRIVHRPSRVSSNRGFFITLSYHSNDVLSGLTWSSPATVAIFNAAAPGTPLARLVYSLYSSTVTDQGGRVYQCSGCANAMDFPIEADSGAVQLAGESSIHLAVAKHPSLSIVSGVTRDAVPWTYSWSNAKFQYGIEWYDGVTVSGPNGYRMTYGVSQSLLGGRYVNVVKTMTDALGWSCPASVDRLVS